MIAPQVSGMRSKTGMSSGAMRPAKVSRTSTGSPASVIRASRARPTAVFAVKDALRLHRADEQEFERLTLRQLRQPPADEHGPFDNAGDEQDLPDDRQRGRHPQQRQTDRRNEYDMGDDGLAERPLPVRRRSSRARKRVRAWHVRPGESGHRRETTPWYEGRGEMPCCEGRDETPWYDDGAGRASGPKSS